MAKPYFFINDQMQTYATLKNRVGGNQKFDALNVHLRNIVVVPGQLVIMGDLSTRTLTGEEIEMMDYAGKVRRHLRAHQVGGDGHLVKNFDLLQQILGYGSLGLGAATGSWNTHLDGVKNTLQDIERLHKLSLARGTPIARQEFINQRKVLFTKLDTQLEGVARWGTRLRKRSSIKKMLGISTKSYLHTQEIRGYAGRIGHIAKASKILKAGTPIGIGLNVLSTGLEIKEACSTGRESECRKAQFIEGSKLVGSVSMGLVFGGVGASAATGSCALVFGIPTYGLGAIGCGIVGGVLAAYGGGLGGEAGGEAIGEYIYEWAP